MKEEEAPSQSFQFRLVFAAALLPVIALFVLVSIEVRFNRPLPGLTETRVFTIAPGASLTELSRNLHEQGIIEQPWLFNALARFRGLENAVREGEYALPAGATSVDLLVLFVSGETLQRRLALIEGWTFAEALAVIQGSEGVKVTLAGASRKQIAEAMGLAGDALEGMIFPDTYFYAAGDSDLDLLLRASARLQQVLGEEWPLREPDLPLASAYEALILASIVEKEAAGPDQRGLIAGVFQRRLGQNMRLQSDPTVIYGLGDAFDGDLRSADLERETAFNTYRIDGLPPTPIALASLDSIRATLRPTPSEYLYFVADDQGGHYFSETLEEHNAAVDCYQRNRDNGSCEQLNSR